MAACPGEAGKPEPSSAIRCQPSSMASSDSTGLYIFLFIVLLIIAFFAYAHVSRRRTENRRKQLIQAFRRSPVVAKNAPILARGQATAPDLLLPTTGEHVAFYGLFVMSGEAAVTSSHAGTRVQVNGIRLGSGGHIDGVKGFRFFETSGDFTITQGATLLAVQPSGLIGYFARGASLVSFAGDMAKQAGLPGQFWDDTMNFQVAEQALKMFCGYEAPIMQQHHKSEAGSMARHETTDSTTLSVVSVKSRIDSRIHYFSAGHNIPEGVIALMAKRGITLEQNEGVIAVETYISLNREVSVFGTFDGTGGIVFADATTGLSVSYGEPDGE